MCGRRLKIGVDRIRGELAVIQFRITYSSFLVKNLRSKICKTIILSAVLCGGMTFFFLSFFLFRKGGLLIEGAENKALRIYERRVWELLCVQVFVNFCSLC